MSENGNVQEMQKSDFEFHGVNINEGIVEMDVRSFCFSDIDVSLCKLLYARIIRELFANTVTRNRYVKYHVATRYKFLLAF